MKLYSTLLLASCLAVCAETKEQINKRFTVQSESKLVVDVDFGSVDVTTNSTSEVTVDVVRQVTRGTKSDEEAFLAERPVNFSQEGNSITIHSRATNKASWSWRGKQRIDGKYTITVPAKFNAEIKTSGGAIVVSDLTGATKAKTSGGGLKFTRLHGTVDGDTSGGSILVAECDGPLKLKTSGGDIDVSGGAGSLTGKTSGGSIVVKDFRGPAQVETSGGGINVENIAGKVEGSTSGGSITARFPSRLSEDVKLKTSAGNVTVYVTEDSAFDLDASTSGGRVSSDLPVKVAGKASGTHLKGLLNEGGKPVLLRTSGGDIQVKKL